MSEADKIIREAIKRKMAQDGLTISQLASKLGITKQALSELLRGGYGLVPASLVEVIDHLKLQIRVDVPAVEVGSD